jgi:hypothetical protein
MTSLDITSEELEFENYKAAQFRIISISYGLFFSLMGIVLTTIEPFKACDTCENYIKITIEAYFIFMYTIALIWMTYTFFLIVQAKYLQKVSMTEHGKERRLSASNRFNQMSRLSVRTKKMKNNFLNNPTTRRFLNLKEEETDDLNHLPEVTIKTLSKTETRRLSDIKEVSNKSDSDNESDLELKKLNPTTSLPHSPKQTQKSKSQPQTTLNEGKFKLNNPFIFF